MTIPSCYHQESTSLLRMNKKPNPYKKRPVLIDNPAQFDQNNDYHEEIEFINIDFDTVPIDSRSFESCTFSSCRFFNMTLSETAFRSCLFDKCELVLAKLHTVTLDAVLFRACKIMGVNFSSCNDFGFMVDFSNCTINNSIFYGLNFKKRTILECTIADSDLSDCDFTEADFSDTHFKEVTVHNCNFEKADFRSAIGYSINPLTNQMRNARFCLPEAQSFLPFLGIKLEL